LNPSLGLRLCHGRRRENNRRREQRRDSPIPENGRFHTCMASLNKVGFPLEQDLGSQWGKGGPGLPGTYRISRFFSTWQRATADNILIIFRSSCRELGGLLLARRLSSDGQTANQEDKENG